ncbi:MAG: HEAT repeat domain-containing protein [Acidobacteriota bacterium]
MRPRIIIIPAASSLSILFLALWLQPSAGGAVPSSADWRQGYVGSEACGSCHRQKHRQWEQSLHSRMIQAAGPHILGDFQKSNTLTHEGASFRMFEKEDAFWVEEKQPDGRGIVYKVDYTLGSKRNQHYISLRPDGRMRVLFPSWDVRKGKWFHSSEIIPTGHHAGVSIQYWNQHCYNCHVSQQDQGFDIRTNTYRTSFTETGINCEMCHGPGQLHSERMKKDPDRLDFGILHPSSLPPAQQMMVCVQCHTPRVIVQHGFQPGKNYYDYYMPTLMHFYIERWYDPPMWPDGRMRRFATEGAALWQSQCFLKGEATCITCHNPHLNTIKRDARYRDTDVLCTQCHQPLKQESEVAKHTHHSLGSEGSQCIGCHMPPETNMMQDQERDHSISTPVPENTVKYDIPNACTTCHTDQTPLWAVRWMDQWYPGRPKGNARRADAFVQAQQRDPAAIDALIALLKDPAENLVIRGSAAGFLGEYQGEKVAQALIAVLNDPEVMVRAEAARSLSEVQSPQARAPLSKLLQDTNRVVRLNAVFALVKMGILEMEGSEAASFSRAKSELEQFFNDFPDVQDIRINLGTYHAVHGRYLLALQEYKNALKLHSQSRHATKAHYFLGITYVQLGLYSQALSSFEKTLQLDPDFRNTRDLMGQVRQAMKQ